jgi:cytochrome c biogenesis protein CcmG, thiol:disulfide interchange protein DsbE
MRRFLIPGLITVVALALVVVLAFGVAGQKTNTSIDNAVARGHYMLAPDSTVKLPLLDSSQTTDLAAFRGRVVLLNVFASWCTTCAAESSVLEQAQRMLARAGGTVLGVTYLDNASDSEAFMRANHLNYPVLRDVSGNFVHAFGTTGVPESFVINREGRIQALQRFQLSTQWVNETLPKIIAERS